MTRKLKGTVRVAVPTSNRAGPGGAHSWVRIEFTDGLSCTQFLAVEMTFEQFGRLVAGRDLGEEVEIEWRPAKVGLRREVKEEVVPYDPLSGMPPERAALKGKALAPFERDGWTGHRDDLGNHHRRVRDGYRVVFERWVEDTDVEAGR